MDINELIISLGGRFVEPPKKNKSTSILGELVEKYGATVTSDDLFNPPSEKICRVSWCNSLVEGYDDRVCYCAVHKQYKVYGKHASVRPWLFYKIEKAVNGELKCERCGYDPKETYPDRDLKTLVILLDVDHINSNLKGTEEGEHPTNYQLLCKHCHILKSIDEGDYQNKIRK